MNRRKLEKEFRQMVKDLDGEKAHNNVAGSVCEHYAIEFAIRQVKNCSIPDVVDTEGQLLAFSKFLLNRSYVRGKYYPETLVKLFKGK